MQQATKLKDVSKCCAIFSMKMGCNRRGLYCVKTEVEHIYCLGRGEGEMMSQQKARGPYVMSDPLITLNRDAAHLGGAFSPASPPFWRL